MSTPLSRLFGNQGREGRPDRAVASPAEHGDAFPSDRADLYLAAEPRVNTGDGSRPQDFIGLSATAQGEEMVAGIDALLGQLSLAYEQQARLIRGIGHDFKSPLSSVLHMSESLESGDFGPLTPEQAECVHLITQASRLLTAQAQALYALGEARSGDNVMGRRMIDLTAVLEMVSDVSAQRARAKGIEFTTALPDVPLLVSATAGAVERILDNAVSNAIKYTERGSVGVTVVVDGAEARIQVTDTGIGIPPEDVNRIGVDFVRAGNTAEIDGTGVGLVVTNHLLSTLGGSMVVESELGTGTTITLTLPLASPGSEG